jgi:hypothetical protein
MMLLSKRVFLSALLLLLLPILTMGQQIEIKQARLELEAVLSQRSKALQQNDYQLLRSFLTTSFKVRNPNGLIITREHMEQAPRLVEDKGVREHSFVIREFKLKGSLAVIEIRHSNSLKQTTVDGSVREAISVSEQREEWIRSSDGWKLQLIDDISVKRSETLLNGKKISDQSTPLGTWEIVPNTVDEPVLKSGYGIVFIYRISDHVLIKAPIFCDDKQIARMTGGSYLKLKLAPGTHTLNSEKGDPVKMVIEAGKLYFLSAKVKTGFPKARGVLELDQDSIGPSAYKFPKFLKLNSLGSDNIDDALSVIPN